MEAIQNKKGRERRRDERFTVKDRVFVTFKPQFDRIGLIADISKGGVSLEYSVIEEYSPLSDNLIVDIFSSTKKFDLFNVPCRLIYDERINTENGFLETTETRRCGLAFAGLSMYQADKLEGCLESVLPVLLSSREK